MNRPPDYVHTNWNQSLFNTLHFMNGKDALKFNNKGELHTLLNDQLKLLENQRHPQWEKVFSQKYLYKTVQLRESHFWVKEYSYPTNNLIPTERKHNKIIRIVTAWLTELLRESRLFNCTAICETLAQKFGEELYFAGVTSNDWRLWINYIKKHEANLIKITFLKKYPFLCTGNNIDWCDSTIKLYPEGELLLDEIFLKCPFYYECYYPMKYGGKEWPDLMRSFESTDLYIATATMYKEVRLYRLVALCIAFFERAGFVFSNSVADFWACFVHKILNTWIARKYISEADIEKILDHLPTETQNCLDVPPENADSDAINAFIGDCICESIKETCVKLRESLVEPQNPDSLYHEHMDAPQTENQFEHSQLYENQTYGFPRPEECQSVDSLPDEDQSDNSQATKDQSDNSLIEIKSDNSSSEKEQLDQTYPEDDQFEHVQPEGVQDSEVVPKDISAPFHVAEPENETVVKDISMRYENIKSYYNFLLSSSGRMLNYIWTGRRSLALVSAKNIVSGDGGNKRTNLKEKSRRVKSTELSRQFLLLEAVPIFFRLLSIRHIYLMLRGTFSYIVKLIRHIRHNPILDMWLARQRRCYGTLKHNLELRGTYNFDNTFNGSFLFGVDPLNFESRTINELIIIKSPIDREHNLEVSTLREADDVKPVVLGLDDDDMPAGGNFMDCNIVFDKDGNFHLEEKPDEMSYAAKLAHVLASCEPTKVWQNDPIYSSNCEDDEHIRRYYWQRYRLFIHYDEAICLDKESWYSVTPEVLAAHQAKRCACDVIIDGFCGVGGNAIQLAQTCRKVIAIDIDPHKIAMARSNAAVYKVSEKIEFMVGDYFNLVPKLKADVVHLSPPWGGIKYAAELEDSTMYDVKKLGGIINGEKMFEVASKVSQNVALYLPRCSNVFQLIEMAGASGNLDLEYAHYNGSTKAITAYFGDLARTGEKEAK